MAITHAHGAVARTASITAAMGLIAVGLAGPAMADEKLITQKYVGVDNCQAFGAPKSQICPTGTINYNIIQVPFDTPGGTIKAEFTANANHCSDMIAHTYIDSQEWGSHVVSPGGTDGGGYEIPVTPGHHYLAIQAEGIPGGCNTGYVSAWGGTERVYQLS